MNSLTEQRTHPAAHMTSDIKVLDRRYPTGELLNMRFRLLPKLLSDSSKKYKSGGLQKFGNQH